MENNNNFNYLKRVLYSSTPPPEKTPTTPPPAPRKPLTRKKTSFIIRPDPYIEKIMLERNNNELKQSLEAKNRMIEELQERLTDECSKNETYYKNYMEAMRELREENRRNELEHRKELLGKDNVIDKYTSRIDDLEFDKSRDEDEIETLKEKVEELENDWKELKEVTDEKDEEIKRLEKELKELEEKKGVIKINVTKTKDSSRRRPCRPKKSSNNRFNFYSKTHYYANRYGKKDRLFV